MADAPDRIAEINAALRTGNLSQAERRPLVHELLALLQPRASAPDPAAAARATAAVARAERLTAALYGHKWSTPDRKLLAGALSETLRSIPDGTYSPKAMTVRDERELRVAILPPDLTDRLGRGGEARTAALPDLDTAIGALGTPAGGTQGTV